MLVVVGTGVYRNDFGAFNNTVIYISRYFTKKIINIINVRGIRRVVGDIIKIVFESPLVNHFGVLQNMGIYIKSNIKLDWVMIRKEITDSMNI